MLIPDTVLDELRARAVCDGPRLVLTGERLDPRLYARIDEVLRGAGGAWNTRQQAHVFPATAAEALDRLLATRRVTTARERVQAQQFFPTPPDVVARLIELADLTPGMRVLEPSAGRGAIALAAADAGATVDAVELVPEHADALRDAHHPDITVITADFLDTTPERTYDRVIMNPPFTRAADIAHVRHALTALRPGGLLVAVMSQAVAWTPTAAPFRALVAERGGTVEALPDGAFRVSGTDVAALIVTIPATPPAELAPPLAWPAATPAAKPAAAEPPPAPAVIARQITGQLYTAARQFGAVAAALERPAALATTGGQLDLFAPHPDPAPGARPTPAQPEP